MATEFVVTIAQADITEDYASQVADAVFAEIDRLEEELSRFRPGSDIWRINHLPAGGQCPIGLAATDCLLLAKAVHRETMGAFDITIGP
ncbi:MAG: FAD:protein FMN transferase, partial [Roseimicrobium sp.]